MMRLELEKVVRSPFCVSNEDGIKVHSILFDMLSNNNSVVISFKGVTRLTTAFLNAAIGQLYDQFNGDEVDSKISIIDADSSHIAKFNKTVANAKMFFSKNGRIEIK